MAIDTTKFGFYVESFDGEFYVRLEDYEQLEKLYYELKDKMELFERELDVIKKQVILNQKNNK